MDLPDDLIASNFRIVARPDRVLLVSPNSGAAVGATLDEAIRNARKIRDFCRYLDAQRAKEQTNDNPARN